MTKTKQHKNKNKEISKCKASGGNYTLWFLLLAQGYEPVFTYYLPCSCIIGANSVLVFKA